MALSPITRTQLENASRDADDLAKIVNEPATFNGTGLVDTRFGGPVKTVQKLLSEIEGIGDGLSDNPFVSNLAALSLVDPDDNVNAFLKESNKEGQFFFTAGDQSAKVTADTVKGTWVGPDASTGYAANGSSGAWKRIRPNKNLHKISEYGNNINVALTVCELEGGGVVELDSGTLVPASALIIPPNVSLMGTGKSIISVGALTSGQLSTNYAAKKDGVGLTSLGGFTSIVAGDEHIIFSATPSAVLVGDIVCIYDSASGSFLAPVDGFSGRSYYRRGQRLRVVGKSGNTLYFDQAIRSGYAAGGSTVVYHQASTKGKIGGLTLDATGYVTDGMNIFRCKFGDRLKFEDFNCIGGSYASCEIDQCFETTINTGTFETNIATSQPNSYPLSIVNSAHTRARNFSANGKWNGVGTGGYDEAGAIQCYDTLFEDFRAAGIDAPGVDMHGNSELTRMIRGRIENGFSFGGKDTYYQDCFATDKDYLYAGLWAELWGGDQHWTGGAITVQNANYSAGTPSITAFGGAAFRACKGPTNIKIDTRVEAPLADWLIGLILDSATYKVNFDINLAMSNVGTLNTMLEINKTVVGNAGDYSRIAYAGLPGGATAVQISGSQPYSASTTNQTGVTIL